MQLDFETYNVQRAGRGQFVSRMDVKQTVLSVFVHIINCCYGKLKLMEKAPAAYSPDTAAYLYSRPQLTLNSNLNIKVISARMKRNSCIHGDKRR